MTHNFKLGDRVIAPSVLGNEVGIIQGIYENNGYAIVEVNNADGCYREKIRFEKLRRKDEVEEPSKDEITVNSARFQEVAIKTIVEESNNCDNVEVMLAFGIFAAKLHKALFETELGR